MTSTQKHDDKCDEEALLALRSRKLSSHNDRALWLRIAPLTLGLARLIVADEMCWRTYKKHERKEGAKQEPVLCLVGR